LTYAQVYEYMVSHALTKSAESYSGIVLCAPGAWCMYRIEALEDTLRAFCLQPKNIREYHRLEQGEDRYLTTLSLARGWKGNMIKSSVAYTKCPESLRRLMEQRRRWNNSTLENNVTAMALPFLWRSAPMYMISLMIDVFCYLMYPAIFITLFGNTMAIAIPLITGWNIDNVRYMSYGLLVLFMLVQIIVFLIPIQSRNLVGFFRFSMAFYSVIIIAVAVFVVLPFVLPRRYQKAPLTLPGFSLGIGGDRSTMQPMFGKRQISESPMVPNFTTLMWQEDFEREMWTVLNLGLLRILLAFVMVFYALVMVCSAFRLRGRKALWICMVGGPIFSFFSPTFFYSFLWFTVTRYDSTAWR